MILNASIYWSSSEEKDVLLLVQELLRSNHIFHIYLLDTSEQPQPERRWHHRVKYLHFGTNIGRAAAHNIAIRESIYDDIPFHLVISPNVVVKAEAVENLLAVMLSEGLIGQLLPRVVDADERLQHVCRLLPTPYDLFRSALGGVGSASRSIARYALRDKDYSRPINAPCLSGCFMLLRTEALLKVGLFDEQFITCCEDIDLCRRLHRDYLTLYYPSETIIYPQHPSSDRNEQISWASMADIVRYFNKWGWLYDTERRRMNNRVLGGEL